MKSIDRKTIKGIVLVLGVLTTAMMLMPALGFPNSDASFTGWEIAFTTEFANLGLFGSGRITFHPFALLAFVLPLAGAVVLMTTNKFGWLAGGLFVVAAILLLTMPQFTTLSVTMFGILREVDVDWTYGIGLVLATILSAVAATLSFYSTTKN